MPKNPSGGGRDSYPTPYPYAQLAVHRALDFHPWETKLHLLEPGCGEKYPFIQAAHDIGWEGELVGVDVIDDWSVITESPNRRYRTDFLTAPLEWYTSPEVREHGGWDIIATNPPYSLAEEFVRRSLEILHPMGVMVMLLRVGFAGSIKRMPLFRERPPVEIGEFVRRFSFDGKGTDYTDYCLFFWQGDALDRALRHRHKGTAPTRFYWIDNSRANGLEVFGI